MATIEIKGVIGQDYTYKQLITDYANAKGELIDLYISSNGGYITDGNLISKFIHDHAANFRRVINSGNVASIASNVFLSLPFEKRFFDMSKGVALIHNPFATDLEGADTTASGLSNMATALLEEEKGISKYITQQTSADPDVISALMSINEPLTEQQLVSINFANIIKFQAVAYLKNEEMDKKEIEEMHQSFLDKLMAIFKTKALATFTLADGTTMEFPDLTAGDAYKVGDKCTMNGMPCNQECLMPDGSTCVCVAGVVTEIESAAMEATEPAEPGELETAKAEIESLKTELATFKAQALEVNELKKSLAKFKSEFIQDDKKEGEGENKGNRVLGFASKMK